MVWGNHESDVSGTVRPGGGGQRTIVSTAGSSFYVTGGTMGGDAPSYVERQADRELFEALLAGEFCYLLTPRQMGKSSLIIRTRQRLIDRQVQAVLLDLSTIGQHVSVEQWYHGLLFGLGQQTGLEDELDRFFERRNDLGLCQRFFAALTEVVLPRCAARARPDGAGATMVRLVVFVDELDVVRSLPFNTDEFFAAIRGCYNLRARDPAMHQLGFALLGVATPADLIRDVRTSPFNIGRRIQLRDFTNEESRPLARGLGPADLAQVRLDRILHWTGGHPYLTQRLCRAVADSPRMLTDAAAGSAVEDTQEIDRICLALYLSRQARDEDDNLIFVRESVLRSDSDRTALLELYRRVKRRPGSVPDDHANPLVNVLHLSGLVGSEEGFLRERNRVYARAFDDGWIDTMLPGAEVRRQRAAFRRGVIRTASISGVILAVILALAWRLRSTELARYRQILQNQSTTVRLTVANGVNHLGNGDWFTACLWFAQALVLDRDFGAGPDPEADQTTHRLRLNSILDQAPQIDQMWFGLTRPARAGGFTPDGQQVLLGRPNGHALFDLMTGQPATPAFGAGHAYASLSPEGSRAVTGHGGQPGPFTVWEVRSGTPLVLLLDSTGTNAFAGTCHDLQFSPDGRKIVAALSGWRCGVWDAATGQLLRLLDYQAEPSVGIRSDHTLHGARFDATSERIVTVGAEKRAVVWTWQSTEPPQVIQAHDSWVYAAAFAPWDTNLLLTCSFDRSARLWDLKTGQRRLTVDHAGDAIYDVAFSPTEHFFVTAGWDLAVRLWDADSGQPIPPILRDRGRTMQVLFSPSGGRLLTGSWDGEARLWDLRLTPRIHELSSCSFSSDGRLAVDCEPQELRFRDAATGNELAARKFPPGTTVRWAVFTGLPDRALACLEQRENQQSTNLVLQLFDALRATPVGAAVPCPEGLANLAWSSKSGRFAGVQPGEADGSTGDAAFVWSANGSTPPTRIARPGEAIERIALGPAGTLLATVSSPAGGGPPSKHLRLHHLDATLSSQELFRTTRELSHITFSPDGRWLAAAETDGQLDPASARLWELVRDDGWVASAQLPHPDGVLFVEFSADSQLLATCSEDQTAIVWHLNDGAWRARTRPLRAHGQVIACAFSSDNAWLATICKARSPRRGPHTRVQLWQVSHGESIGLPYEFPLDVERVQFVAQDTRLLVEGGAPPQRWLLDLSTSDESPHRLLLRAELFSGQHSFLRERPDRESQSLPKPVELEEVLPYSAGMGPLRPLSVEESEALWLQLVDGD